MPDSVYMSELTCGLHCLLQMSAAWAALDAATGADHPTAAAINEALRHARPYRELAECIRAAERFLSNLQSQTAGQLPNSQHSMAQSTESQTVSGSQAADDVEEAEDSVPDVNADGDQQDGTASIAGSEVVSRRSVQPLHDIETESFSSHQDPEQFQWQPYDADPLRSSTSSSQPLEAPAQDQAASHKPFVLSPKAVASAKAAAVLALAQPATVQIEHPPASVSSLSSSSPTFLSHAQPEPLSQPEQPAYAEPSPQPEQQFAVDTDRPDESTNVGTTMPATQSTAKPPSSMLDFLSFLLPAENLTANPTPKRQPPPGFEAPKLQGQSASGRAADTSAQGASQQPQGLPRRAKAYQSAVTRGPAALYQPPGMAEHHTSEDSWNAADDASQQQQYSLHEPYQEQEPAADVWQQQQTVKYDPPQQQQASKYDPAHQQQQAAKYDPAHQQQQQQAPKYDPVHQQRPALYIPAPLQQSSAPGTYLAPHTTR